MDDMNSMNREQKKQQLRRQIVPNPKEQRPVSPVLEDGAEEEAIRKAHHKVLRRRIMIGVLIFVVLAAIAGGVMYWQRYHQYTEYSTSWEVSLLAGDGEAK
ncbi:MAG: hypothetical protein Q4F76_00485, partial [Lachnospiraceae bacterium]|nr:hypothetical protein [Lachnospiraceae bacterium]